MIIGDNAAFSFNETSQIELQTSNFFSTLNFDTNGHRFAVSNVDHLLS